MTLHDQEVHEELIQRSLDGKLSRSDQNRLSELLATSDRVRATYDSLKKVDTVLAGAPLLDPPPGLAKGVMARLQARHHPARISTSTSLWERITAALRARPAYGVSLGFALGVLVLLPMALQLPSQQLDPASITGTMTNGNHAGGGFEARPLPISLDRATGECQAMITDGAVTVILKLDSVDPMEVELAHDGTKAGLSSLLVGSGTARYMEAQGQRVRLMHQGSDVYRFKFVREPGVGLGLGLSLLRDGEVLFEEPIPVTAVAK